MAKIRAAFGDKRLEARFAELSGRLSEAPGLSLPQALEDEASLEAAYRFFGNPRVMAEDILAPHVAETVTRMATAPECVVAHDTTEFQFTGDREGLGRIRTGTSQGFLAHVALAVTLDEHRAPLGVMGSETWTREQERRPRLHPKKRQLDPSRESQRWGRLVQTVEARCGAGVRPIHVMDREADAYDLLDLLVDSKARFVVRHCMNRKIVEADGASTVLVADRGRHVADRAVMLSPRPGSVAPQTKKIHPPREARLANLEIHARSLVLRRPDGRKTGAAQLTVNMVTVQEREPPEGEEPVTWRLYTTEPVETAQDALQVVDAYRCRWRIEEYFKALKSGCAIEKRQLGSLASLLNILAVFMPIAWRLLALAIAGRERPSDDPRTAVTERQLEILHCLRPKLPETPTAHDVMLAIASLGGHLRRNGNPGWKTLGAGYERLLTIEEGYRLARARCDQS